MDLNALDATQVNRLLEELQDEVGNPPDEEDESDEGDED